jgi:MGT family glycosyltransferase
MARRAAAAAGSAAASRMGAYVHNDLVEALAKRTSFPLRAQRAERYMPYDLHFKDLPEWVFFGPDMELPRREPLPAGVRFVGPSVDLERHEEPIALSQGKKRIYVGMGTVEQMGSNHWFLRHIIEAFRHDTDVEVIMSCGGESARKALGETPPHIRTYAYVPQLAALDGCALAITHGGAGTYRECVVKGVPMLVYPRNHDQFGNAARVVFHGLGLAGVRTEASAAKVRAQARTIMDDVGYRDRVWLMRERVLAHEAAVDLRALVHDAAARH